MAQAFNLTAQLQLQSPRNVNQVVNDIRRQLKPVGVQVKIENTRNLARANKDLAAFSRNARNSNKNMSELNRTLQESARRFSVITIATGSFLALANAFKKSVKEAVAFERELVRISQVTGKSVSQLRGLSQEVTRLATSLGTSSSDLLNVARTLSQAGFAAEDTRRALDILAKTTLAATFDNIQDTTEGAIALLRQFGNEARSTGGDIKFLESSLDAINAVSKRFAVESGDLITAIRRTGGVFSAAGGSINELIALFTSVRATTRESAETIATGLRTIFTRIQRVETIEQLRTLGIELQDAQGNFVGAFEAFKRLSQGLKGLDPRSVDFSSLVEELGGFRQVGKVIPLIQQFTTAQQALSVAQGASGSTARDAQIAQQSLGVQIQKVREQFDALIRKFADSSTFRSLANGALELAKAFIKIADSLEPLLPLLVSLVGLKLGQGIAPALAGIAGVGRRVGGTGPVTKFARGGMVPGSGNRDTVPAMLTPGEFVIRKSSVNKLGAGTLAAMNENRYARGGKISIKSRIGQVIPSGQPAQRQSRARTISVGDLRSFGSAGIKQKLKGLKQSDTIDVSPTKVQTVALNKDFDENKVIGPGLAAIDKAVKAALPKGTKATSSIGSDTKARESIGGFAFERFASAILGVTPGGETTPFDFTGVDPKLSKIAKRNPLAPFLDAKRSEVSPAEIVGKALRESKVKKSFTRDQRSGKRKAKALGGLIQKFAAGGIVGQKAAGAAILDPEPASSKSVTVGVEDVKKKFSEFSKLAKGKDPVSKFYKSTSFNVAKSGLDKETSNKFKIALEDGLISGINTSASILANDLGTPNAKIDQSQATNFVKGINTQVFGRLFETTVDSIKRQGNYDKPDNNPNRPFDAEQGLPSVLKDNFKGLPDKFIDLKTSAAAASDANLKGKILDQIKIELIRDGILNADYPGKAGKDKDRAAREAKDEKQRQADKASGRGFPARRNAGGPAPSDTVPALLTPGEFVFNKKAADSIGRANLDRMNKQGVQGFAKGGSVGVQRFQFGGTPSAVPLGTNVGALDDLVNSARRGSRSIDQLGQSSKRASVGFAERANSVASAAQQFVFLGSSITALTSSFSSLDDVTQTAINRTAGELVGIVGIVGTLTQVFTSAAIASKANTEAIIQETVTRKSSAVAGGAAGAAGVGGAAAKASKGLKGFGAAILGLIGGPWGLLIAGVTLLVGAFLFAKNKVKAENEALAKAAKDLADKFKETGEGLTSYISSVRSSLGGESGQTLFGLGRNRIQGEDFLPSAVPFFPTESERASSVAAFEVAISKIEETADAFSRFKKNIDEQREAYKRINSSIFDADTKFVKLSQEVEKGIEANAVSAPSIGDLSKITGQFDSIEEFERALENPFENIEGQGKELTASLLALKNQTDQLQEAQKFAAENIQVASSLFNQALGKVTSRADVRDVGSDDPVTEAGKAFKILNDALEQEVQIRRILLKIQLASVKDADLRKEIQEQIDGLDDSLEEAKKANIQYAKEIGGIQERKAITERIKRESDARKRSIEVLESFNSALNDVESLLSATRGEDPNSAAAVRTRIARREQQRLSRESSAAAALSDRDVGLGRLVGKDLASLLEARESAAAKKEGLGTGKLTEAQKDQLALLNRQIAAIDAEIERRSDQTKTIDEMKASMKDNIALINKERQARKQVLDVLEEFVVGGEETRQNLAQAARGVQLAVGTGTLQNQSEEQRKATVSLLKRLGDAPVTFDRATGAQLTGEDVLKRLLANDLFRMGAGGLAQAVLNSTTVEERLIKSNEILANTILNLARQMQQAGDAAADIQALGAATGGLVQYRANGGSIFKPKGTDTVPAMLSPGEFVVRKSAVDKVGVGALQTINSGGSPVYARKGGLARKVDEFDERNRNQIIPADFIREEIAFDRGPERFRGFQTGPQGELELKRAADEGKQFLGRGIYQSLRRSEREKSSRRLRQEARFGDRKKRDFGGGLRARQKARFGRDLFGERAGMDKAKIDAIRRERGMRSRGRGAGGQRFGAGIGIGGQAINFLSGYGGGFGGGFGGPQTVPFGFIPGSPFNQLLGRGGFNIPRFDPRLLFGNLAAFFNKGGSVGGDTIPAMLTPGEFVMSAGAVKKHGVGFMNKLNKGNVKGFNKGGSVGGVQYRQEGGLLGTAGSMLGFDTSEIQGVFDGFVANFSSVLDNIVAPFNNVVQNLNQLSQAFGNLTMQHTVNVEGLISVGGLNIESIKNELSQSIGEMVAGEVQRVMNDQQKNFKSN